ncbi:hypothetical protein [Vibrio sp. WXL210]|uniref:hypothetical protein n=1 Tax=Vibrio sp. WXL210 TaxID=3450709 RepID=UPI003EC80AF3
MLKYSQIILPALVALTLSSASMGCGFHLSGEDGEPLHPGSTYVIWRTITAEKTKLIEPVPSLEGEAGFRRASWWLTLLARQLEELGVEQTDILIADVPLWSRYEASGSRLIQIDTGAPSVPSSPLVLTTLSGLNALITGQIDLISALEQGFVQVRNDPDGALLPFIH